jgi:hypothetical protein
MAIKKPSAIQIAVYDLGGVSLPDKLVKELQRTVDRLLKDSPNLAQTIVTE